MTSGESLLRVGLGGLLALLVALAPQAAEARPGMHTIHLDGGGAVMVTSPQSERFDFGGGLGLGYELRPIPYFGVGARFSMYFFPSTSAAPTVDGFGAYYAPTLELRGHPLADLDIGDLWVSAAATVTITGDVVRPGLEVGVGYDFEILDWLRAGPFVRYHHVFETDQLPGASDAGFLSFGASLAFLGDSAPDRDGDGIADASDACPDEPEDIDDFEDDNGCPDPDNDGDGVLDSSDGCPMQAEDVDEFEDENGCPDPDNDADRVADTSDRCPNEPEDANGLDDEDGCPDQISEAEQELERLAERVQFPHDRVRIVPSSRPALERVAMLLQQDPQIRRIRIEAHASREGTPEYNRQLSERRALRVIEELVQRGVARERLTYEAYGDTRPARTEDTPEAAAVNRRVEFVVIERAR